MTDEATIRRRSRGVSSTIAVALMVAVVVVLSAVAATTFLGFGNELSNTARAAASVEFHQGSDGSVEITYVDRGNTEKLEVNYTISPAGNSLTYAGDKILEEPGQTLTLEEAAGNPDDDVTVHVTVTAYLTSGQEVVVYDNEKTI